MCNYVHIYARARAGVCVNVVEFTSVDVVLVMGRCTHFAEKTSV